MSVEGRVVNHQFKVISSSAFHHKDTCLYPEPVQKLAEPNKQVTMSHCHSQTQAFSLMQHALASSALEPRVQGESDCRDRP